MNRLLLALTLGLTAFAQADDRHLLITFPWSTKNIGDIAITPGLLSLIQEAHPGMKAVVITSRDPGTDNYRELKDYLPRYLPGCETIGYPFKMPPEGQLEEAKPEGAAWRAFVQRWGASKWRGFENGTLSARIAGQMADDLLNRLPLEMLEELKQTNPEAARAFTDAGFVLYTSGTTLNFGRMGVRDFRTFTLRYSMPLLMARALGIPYGVNAQSFDALDWPSNLIFGPLFKDARFVYARDPDSLAYLQQQGLLCARSGWRPDTTFFFNGFDNAWADAFMKRHALETGRFITVTVRSANQTGPLAGTMTDEREEAIMSRMRRFIEQWVAKTGLPVVLAPEVKSEVQAAHERIFAKLSPEAQKKTIELAEFWTTEQAYSLYQRAQAVVSMEMHSVIMAVSLGTPVLMPQFSENGRKVWMLEELGLGDWIFDIDEPKSPEAVLAAALKIHADPAAAQARVRAQLPRIRQLGLSVITEVETGWRR
ncbi:MAG: polysaccharide pyruvyl transferase family protein [Verrucomicrobiales bacterium]|nr:polysaccharide pyruvyl transferase family protein [Verrucomicrobiales bacterium]